MKKSILLFMLFFLQIINAQTGQKYEFKLSIYSENNRQQKTLLKACGPEENFEGYFSDNHLFDFIPMGKAQKGGFSLIDKDIFGGIADGMKKEWQKNNFTDTGLNSLVPAPEFTKALSFQISVLPDNKMKDSLHLYIKYAIHTLKNREDFRKTDLDLNVKLDYKHYIIPINKEIPLNIFSAVFKGYHFCLKIDSYRDGERALNFGLTEAIDSKLKQSSPESILKNNKINFNVTFTRRSVFPPKGGGASDFYDYVEYDGLSEYNILKNRDYISKNLNGTELPFFTCSYDLPFSLFNKEKMSKYTGYKTFAKYFVSHYDIIIIPVSISPAGLTADVYIDHQKLNLEDNFKRWTPVYKRIEIPFKGGIKIDIPKENWTANFNRQGEQYDIYGYSDYEKFIDEIIYISFKTNF